MTKYPPGDEIYRKDNLSVFEVDGKLATVSLTFLLLFIILDRKRKKLKQIIPSHVSPQQATLDTRSFSITRTFPIRLRTFYK